MAAALCTPVTYAANASAGSASSITTVESPTTTTGSLIAVGVRCNSVSVTVSSVTDTAGNTYTKIGSTLSSSVTSLELWYAWNITAHATNFVTANFSGAVGSRYILAAEFLGVQTSSNPFDVTANGTGSGQSATTGSFTTTTAEQLILAVSQHESSSSGWVGYDPNHLGVVVTGTSTDPVIALAFKNVVAIQTGVTVTIGSAPSVARQLIVATFKLAASTGGAGYLPVV